MRATTRIALLGAAIGGFFLLAEPVSAQNVLQTQVVPSNEPARASGSCLYGRSGELLHAPRGARCPAREQTPAVSAAPPAAAAAGALPYSVRVEARQLLIEREALDVDLARARQAVASEDREAAARIVDATLGKIARHLEREARLLQPLSAGTAAPQ